MRCSRGDRYRRKRAPRNSFRRPASTTSSISVVVLPGTRSPKVAAPASWRSTGASSEISTVVTRRAWRIVSTVSSRTRAGSASVGERPSSFASRLSILAIFIRAAVRVRGIELAHRLEQALVPDRDQLRQVEPVPLEPLHVGDDEPEVRGHQAVDGDLVAAARAPGQPDFLLLVRDHRELANVEQVLIERVPGSSSVQGFGGRSFTDAWHAASYGLEPQFGTLGEGTRGTRITMCLGNSERRNRI